MGRTGQHMPANGRKAARAPVAAAVGIAILCLLLSGCADDDALDPALEYATELKLGTRDAELKRYLRAGVYVVEMRERDVEVRAKVSGPASQVTLADDVPRHGILITVVRCSAPALVRIRLENAEDPGKVGSVQIRISRLQYPATAPPSELESGYATFGAASEQIARDTISSRERAIGSLRSAIAHFAAAGNVAAVAQAQYSLGYVEYLRLNDWAASIRASDEARKSYELLRDAVGMNDALTLRAANEFEIAARMDSTSSREQSKLFARADQNLLAAARFFHEHELPVREAYARNMLGVSYYYRGSLDDSAATFLEAALLSHRNLDAVQERRSRSNLAAVRYSQGHIAGAAREFRIALSLVKRERDPYNFATLSLNYGWALAELGEFDPAVENFTAALRLFTDLGQKQERAIALSALGTVYLEIGNAERALPALLDAAEESRLVGELSNAATTLRQAGKAAAALGRHEQALAFLRDSLKATPLDDHAEQTRILIARELRSLGDLRGAQIELAAAMRQGSSAAHAVALEERGLLRLAQGQTRAAIADLRAADASFESLGAELKRIDTLSELSGAVLKTDDVAAAADLADQAIAIERRIRHKLANPERRARFLAARYSPYEARIAAYLADRGDELGPWLAFRLAEEVRARSLFDRLDRAPSPGAAPRDIVGDEMRQHLATLHSRLEAAVEDPATNPRRLLDLRTQIAETRAGLDGHLARTSPVVARERTIPMSLPAVQAALPPDTAVLAFFAGTEKTHVWLLTRSGIRHATSAGGRRLARQVEDLVSNLPTRSSLAQRTAFSRSLFGSLFERISEKRLLILADGPLNGLPFAALPVPGSATGEIMLERFVISSAPSLYLAMKSVVAKPARHARVAIVSDPIFSRDDNRLAAVAPRYARALRGPGPLARLRYSAIEARAVRRAFPAGDTIDLAGLDATAARVLDLRTEDLAVLHFSTHAQANSDSPELSAMYLSRFGSNGNPVDKDRLTAEDIATSGLRADIVVLSGCSTGMGSTLRGEGVLGLTYGFLANGSNAVIASLWEIEDAPTARFMEKFYSGLRETGRAADALRIAQLEARRESSSSVWSSFVARTNAFP
jgi:tetratricopeptide (TPR) repeat protein